MSLSVEFPDHWPLCDDCGHVMPEGIFDPSVFRCINCGATKPRRDTEVPRGFTRCDDCEGSGGFVGTPGKSGLGSAVVTNHSCPSCSGSGLAPTEKLREEAIAAIEEVRQAVVPGATHIVGPTPEADAVLRKVAEHIGEER